MLQKFGAFFCFHILEKYLSSEVRNMRRIHWEEIIESDTQSIYLIGYGSILNSMTHE